MKQRAFTLIEILVCVAVVAILLALAAGGLGSMQRRSAVAADLNNFRQIGVALTGHLADYNYRMPPVIASGPKYAQDFLAEQLGMTVSLRDPSVSRRSLGVWISPGDKRRPPYLSALRSYAVNYYGGDIFTLPNDNTLARTYWEINQPSKKLYFLPAGGNVDDPNAQARFSHVVRPIVESTTGWMEIRFYENDMTPALWMDGHASLISKDFLKANAQGLILPKVAPTEK